MERTRADTRSGRGSLVTGALAMVAFVAGAHAAGAPVAIDEEVAAAPTVTNVRYVGDRLSVDVVSESLHRVLFEIGRQSGAQLRLEGVGDRQISDRFSDVPLDDALRRLFTSENFTLVYVRERDPGGRGTRSRLAELQVFGDGNEATTIRAAAPTNGTATAPAGVAPGLPSGTMMEQLAQLLERHAAIPVPPGGPLATALGADTASVQHVLATAMQTEDTAVRAEAARLLAGVFDGDPQTRALVGSAETSGVNTDVIAAAVRASGGPHAQDVLREIAINLRSPDLRVRANQILARLRSVE